MLDLGYSLLTWKEDACSILDFGLVDRMMKTVIGITGGTCSGKTTFAQRLIKKIGSEKALVISQDAYYLDASSVPLDEQKRRNYDHPSAFENQLLLEHLDAFKAGRSIPQFTYDYERHTRVVTGKQLMPKAAILVEGIMVLEAKELRKRFDIKVFIDVAADIRLLRKLSRDVRDRGRTLESAMAQYHETVFPMEMRYRETSKLHADIIVPIGGQNEVALGLVAARVKELLGCL